LSVSVLKNSHQHIPRFKGRIPYVLFRCLMFLTFLFFAQSVRCELAGLDQSQLTMPLGKQLRYIEDSKSVMTVNDFLNMNKQDLIQSDREVLFFGFTDSPYWFVGQVTNQGKDIKKYYVEVKYPHLDEVDIYLTDGNKVLNSYQLGADKAFDRRPIDHRNIVLPIILEPNRSLNIIMRVQTDNLMIVSLLLHDADFFWQNDAVVTIVNWFFFGIMLVMIVYNYYIYRILRERSYLFYVSYIVSSIVFQLCYTGYGYQYLWSASSYLNEKLLVFSLALAFWSLMYFTRSFFSLSRHIPEIDRLIRVSGLVAIFIAFSTPIVPESFSILILRILSLIAMPLLIIGIAYRIKQGNKEARYSFLVYLFVVIGSVLLNLRDLDFLPHNFITNYSLRIGSAIFVTSFTLILARRISLIQEDNLEIQQDILEMQAEAADVLQQKVEERTAALETKTEEAEKSKIESERLKYRAEKQAEELKEIDIQRTTFFQNMSHELRTPLTLILNPLENASNQYENDRNIEVATKNARRLLRLVNQLLDFQKLEAGKKDINLSPIELTHFLKVCGDYFLSATGQKGRQFSIKCNKQELADYLDPIWVMGEIDAFEKIVFNYLSNALKYCPLDGSIELGVEVKPNRVRLYVTDTGQGITEEDQRKLFQVFSQVDDEVNRSQDSSGLGLALVKSLAEDMGGHVGVESCLGKGSQFWAEFELMDSVKSVVPVLIVENDDHLCAAIVERIVKELDLNESDIVVKSNAEDALAFLDQYSISCVISDYQLPGEDGLYFMRSVMERYPKSFRILMTSEANFGVLEPAINENLVHLIFHKSDDYAVYIEKLVASVGDHTPEKSNLVHVEKPVLDILIVDDDELIRKSLINAFAESKEIARCVAVSNVESALEHLSKYSVSSVLSDYRLPTSDGLSLLKKVAHSFPDTLRIFMTGEASFEVMDRAVNEASVQHIFYKPIDVVDLVRSFEEMLKEHSNHDRTMVNYDYEVKSWHINSLDGRFGNPLSGDEDQHFVGEGSRIIVVDDLPDMRDLIASSLQERNYSVKKVGSARKALQAISCEKPDLIITDWIMPEMSGPEMIKYLRDSEEFNSIPIILLTAKSDQESKLTGTEIGADAFLSKPFNDQELASTVRNLIQLKSQEDKLLEALKNLKETSERELRQAKNMLAQQEKLSQLGAMVSSIGHEIASPVTLVTFGCFNMKNQIKKIDAFFSDSVTAATVESVDFEKVRERINDLRSIGQDIATGADRLHDLSMALCTQSRVEKEATDGVSLNDLIKESILIAGGRIKQHHIEEDLGDIAEVRCYRSEVGQVIINLLVNAGDALSDKVHRLDTAEDKWFEGRILIQSKAMTVEDKSGVLVVVSDNGDGVPEASREEIFLPFFTTKKAGVGTGLGLSICQEIVAAHGGAMKISDDNELGGARFEIWLPLEMDFDPAESDAA